MAYDDKPRKPIEIRDGGRDYANHEQLVLKAGEAGKYCVRTDVLAEGAGYLGMDDIDRIRRENLKHKTR